jgi:hypothetical protein
LGVRKRGPEVSRGSGFNCFLRQNARALDIGKKVTDYKSATSGSHLFRNADVGFDTENLRNYCQRKELFANIDFNRRNGNISDREEILDKQLYKRRFVVERMNAWIDGFKALLIRYETKEKHWKCLHLLAFCCILIRKH